MADHYISKYSNNKTVSAAQYITELICEHKAQKDKKDLHFKFWLNKTWEKFYRDQIATANKLLKKYSARAVIKALGSTEAIKIYSLRAPHLVPIIEKFEDLCRKEQDFSNQANIVRNNIDEFSHRKSNSKSILSKLKELDNDS